MSNSPKITGNLCDKGPSVVAGEEQMENGPISNLTKMGKNTSCNVFCGGLKGVMRKEKGSCEKKEKMEREK